MTPVQCLLLSLGIFGTVVLAIQLILIFFGPTKAEKEDATAIPFTLHSLTAYVAIFGWAAFCFSFYTYEIIAALGGFMVAYISSVIVLIIFKKDFVEAFSDYMKKKREREAASKQITMEEAIKEKEEEKIVVKQLEYTKETEEVKEPVVEAAEVVEEKVKETKVKKTKKEVIIVEETIIEEPKKEAEVVVAEESQTNTTTKGKKKVEKEVTVAKTEEDEIQDLLRRLRGTSSQNNDSTK